MDGSSVIKKDDSVVTARNGGVFLINFTPKNLHP